MTRLDIVESYYESFSRTREFVLETRESARTRLVWFVAIAGYILVNAEPYWSRLANRELTTTDELILSAPWTLTVLFAVVTHFLIDEMQVKDDRYFNSKLAAIDLHRIEVAENTADPAEMMQLVRDTHPSIADERRAVNRWSSWVGCFERLAFLFVLVGVLMAVLYPTLAI